MLYRQWVLDFKIDIIQSSLDIFNNSKFLAHALLMFHYYVYETMCEIFYDSRTILTSIRRKK